MLSFFIVMRVITSPLKKFNKKFQIFLKISAKLSTDKLSTAKLICKNFFFTKEKVFHILLRLLGLGGNFFLKYGYKIKHNYNSQ